MVENAEFATPVAYDPAAATWCVEERPGAIPLPALEGRLRVDDEVLRWAAEDYGHLVHQRPRAVLRPSRARDVVKIVEFGARSGIRVAARGAGHSQGGQAQTAGGIVVDMSALNDIRLRGSSSISVGGGALWSEVLSASLAHGFTPPVLTDYLGATVGGTLSTGGIGGASQHFGTQTDAVKELEVVTGTGALVTCSPAHERELFDAVRAGLGQFGIIVSATVDLVPAPRWVRRWTLPYRSRRQFRRDAERLVRDQRFDHLEGQVLPVGGEWRYVLVLAAYSGEHDPGSALEGLSCDAGGEEVEDVSYAEFAARLTEAERLFAATGEWHWPHPWLNAFVPASAVEDVLAEVTGDPRHWPDAGGSSLVVTYPVPARRLRTPMLVRPRVDDVDEAVWLVAVLRAVEPERRAVDEVLAANREVLGIVETAGGRAYPVNAPTTEPSDWSRHYSGRWRSVAACKQRFDPCGVLAPGQPVATALAGSGAGDEGVSASSTIGCGD